MTIDHQFDVYHIVNGIRKELNDIVRYKRHAYLTMSGAIIQYVREIVTS